jgi:hypothetical protein
MILASQSSHAGGVITQRRERGARDGRRLRVESLLEL